MKERALLIIGIVKLFVDGTMGFSEDEFVHELGTGAMAYHWNTLPKFDLSIFQRINMTDIYFSDFSSKKQNTHIKSCP